MRLIPFIRAAALLLTLTTWAASGAVVTWTNTNGGSWNVAENWDLDQVPGVGDTAVITNAGTYVVSVDGGLSLDSLVLGAGVGTQSLALGQSGFSCSGNLSVNSGAILEVN